MVTIHSISIAIPHGTQQLRSSFVAKIISKCTPDWSQNPPQNASKSFNSGSTRVQTVGVLPRMIFHRFWGPVLELEMLPKSIPKSRHFQVSPRNSFYAMGAPKTLQNYLQNYPKIQKLPLNPKFASKISPKSKIYLQNYLQMSPECRSV